MNEKTLLDRLHARAQGWLGPGELAALERELALRPELAELARDYALVHSLTGLDPAREAASLTSFEDLENRIQPHRIARRVAAAAGLLLVAAVSFWAGRRDTRPDPLLVLRAIELDHPVDVAALPADLPLQWVDYDPRGDGRVRFLSDLDEAELMARTVQRPLLVYGSYPGCPMCAAMDARVFCDPRVVDLAERTVPVRINLAELSTGEQASLVARGYPFLEMWREDGRPAATLARIPDPGRFVESLHDGLERSDAIGEQPPWEGLHLVARRLLAARRAEDAGEPGTAQREYQALARDPDVPRAFEERARAGLARIAARARATLLEARALAREDPAAAQHALEEAVERFAGTSFEADLAATLERLRVDGRFPRLAEADRSS